MDGGAMLIRSNLFNKGFMTKQPSLSDVLEGHKQGILGQIKGITELSEMTDEFLAHLVKESLIAPLSLQFGRMARQLRTEQFDGADFPFDFNVERGRRYPKTVARIAIPFSGDPKLLEHTPNEGVFNFPRGEVSGHAIQFDVILWGYQDDANRIKEEIQRNRELLELYATNVNKQLKAFNEALPEQIKTAFAAKLDELTKQYAIFDGLGIEEQEEPAPVAPAKGPAAAPPKKGRARAAQILQHVEHLYVQQLNQTNYNIGDVNNAIQASE
jgi:hypothetical protein